MFPSAPTVSVYAPTILFAGREAVAEIVIEAKKETKVDSIEVRLTGHQGWSLGSNTEAYGGQTQLPQLYKLVAGKGVIPAGTSKYRVSFALPAAMPPSHALSPAAAKLELYVHVAIPWWPDGKYTFYLPVRVPPPREIKREPFAIRTSGAPGDARMELSLASTKLVAGETVVGSVALFHLSRDDRKPRTVDITLIPQLRLYYAGHSYDRRGPTLGVKIDIPPGSAGTSVPFHFRLPSDITPTFKTITHELSWWLYAKTGSLFGTKLDLTVPLEVYDASAAAKTERLVVAPRLSDARIEGAFKVFCERHGWRRVANDRDPDELVVEYDVGHARLQLGYAYRERGAFLVGRVRFPLGLGLDVTPSTPIKELLSKDIEIDVDEFDRTHRVIARSAEQTAPYLRAALPAVRAAETQVGRLQRWSDDELLLERSVLAVEAFELADAARTLVVLAGAIAAIPIAPPVTVDLDEYKRLVQRLDGKLTPGDLAVTGKLDQLPVEIVLEVSSTGVPRGLRVHVGDAAHAPAGLEQGTRESEDVWPANVSDVRIVDGVATGLLDVQDAIDVRALRELVFGLRGWLERLRNPDGPYR